MLGAFSSIGFIKSGFLSLTVSIVLMVLGTNLLVDFFVMALFSERYGYTKPSEVLIREKITTEIENVICSC